jgi:prepilin-type N-terminal cleavage/methylation domain-containing protein
MISETGRNKGFTLVEVIISIGILTFGLILILQGFALSLHAINISYNNLKAGLLADEITSQFLIDFQNAKYGTQPKLSGGIETENAKFDWTISLKQDSGYKELNEVIPIVSWVSGRREGSVSVPTYLRVAVEEDEDEKE